MGRLQPRPYSADTTHMFDLFSLAIAALVVMIVVLITRAVRVTQTSIARAHRDMPLSRPDVARRVIDQMRSAHRAAVRSEAPDRATWVVGLVLLLAGLGPLAGSAYTYRQQAAFVNASHKAAGVVIANQWRENRIQGGDETPGGWAPVVRFGDAAGNPFTFTSDISTYPSPDYSVGSKVEVLYDARNPRRAEIRSFMRLWLVPVVLFGIGSVAALFGSLLLRSARTARR
jgi:hypothetical protein